MMHHLEFQAVVDLLSYKKPDLLDLFTHSLSEVGEVKEHLLQ